jgi:hypothetical protein
MIFEVNDSDTNHNIEFRRKKKHFRYFNQFSSYDRERTVEHTFFFELGGTPTPPQQETGVIYIVSQRTVYQLTGG